MATLLVSAYYYFLKEKELILENMTPISETEAYIFGTLETSKIALLKKHSILMDFHRNPSEQTTGIPRSIGTPSKGQRSVQLRSVTKVQTPYPHETNFYLIQLMGPLLPSWKTELINNHVELREMMEPNIYKVKTREPNALKELQFISDYRPFAMVDKEMVLKRSVSSYFDLFASPSIVAGVYDVRLHRDANTKEFVAFLKTRKIPVLEQSGIKFRIRIKQEEELILLGQQETVYGVEEYVKPVLHNYLARKSLHIDVSEEDRFLIDISLTGAGEIVGVADTGIDAEHPDLKDRILKATAWGRSNDTSDPNGHGTHVSGSIVGNGISSNGKIKGMAPEAKLFFQSLLDNEGGISGIPHDLAELFQEAYDAGVRVHNNSWGSATESEYRFNSLEVDEFVYNHKDMLLVISAGNEGTAFNPRNSDAGFVDWLSLGSPATAKNAICVGACRSARTTGGFSNLTYGTAWPDKYPDQPIKDLLISGDPEGMAGFSSRGPCGNESRIKPDVVAPGTDIASTYSAEAPTSNFWGPYPHNRKYAFMGGTSMAAPIISGFAVLLREYIRKAKGYREPSAALLKSIIINSTRQLSGTDALADHDYIPNFHQGFGCVDMLNVLPSLKKENLHLHFLDTWKQEELQFKASGQRFLFRFELEEGTPLRLCLCWTDPPGRGLQNNLNLMLLHVKSERKWVGNEQLPRMITSFDRDNNVEIIRIDDPHRGEYRIAIQAHNLLVGGQDFALSVTGNIKNGLELIK